MRPPSRPLTQLRVQNASPGKHYDSNGLRLEVSPSGAKKWILRYTVRGRTREMGLGSFPVVGLADARQKAMDARRQISNGVDPIDHRRAQASARGGIPTFGQIADIVVAEQQAKGGNEKVKYQWGHHLRGAYCSAIRDMPINEITTLTLAEKVLRPIWNDKPEVTRKLLSNLRRVFDRARVTLKNQHGIDMSDPTNRSDLKAMGLERIRQLTRGHHPALPYQRLPEFMRALQRQKASSARALEFLILTNVRTGSVLQAEWSEIDLDGAQWVIPIEKLKDRLHRTEAFRVPLSSTAIGLLQRLPRRAPGRFLFPGQRADRPMSIMTMANLVRRMNASSKPVDTWQDPDQRRPIVPHGFRSTFRVWAEEAGRYQQSVIEQAMGHAVGNRVERAYRRTDVMALRRAQMEDWASYADGRMVQSVSA